MNAIKYLVIRYLTVAVLTLVPLIAFISTSASTPPISTSAGIGRIVFSSNHEGTAEIYIASADGTTMIRLTHSDGESFSRAPRLSPDGSQIVFVKGEKKEWPDLEQTPDAGSSRPVSKLYIMNADGSDQHRLTSDPEGYESAEEGTGLWSPDGQQILFSRVTASTWPAPFVINPDGSNERQLGKDFGLRGYSTAGWTIDSETVVLSYGIQTISLPVGSDDSLDSLTVLSDYPNDNASTVTVSPNGMLFTLISHPLDVQSGKVISDNVLVGGMEGNLPLEMRWSGRTDRVSWSSDSSAVFLFSYPQYVTREWSTQLPSFLLQVDAINGNRTTIIDFRESGEIALSGPYYTGHDKVVAIGTSETGIANIYTLSLDGSTIQNVTNFESSAEVYFGNWQQNDLDFSEAVRSSESQPRIALAVAVVAAVIMVAGGTYHLVRKRLQSLQA